MAYIMITSHCNMSCAHCCMSCGKNFNGQHMDSWTYQNALDFCHAHGGYVVLGGGEPTLHPKFIEYLAKAIQQYQADGDMPPWFATNGSKTELVKKLIRNSNGNHEEEFLELLNKNGYVEWQEDPLFDMAVSKDIFHDPIDPEVYTLCKNFEVEIRDASNNVNKIGHANHGEEDTCGCSTLQIKPDGDIFLCGCDEAPRIGNVNTDTDIDHLIKELHDVTDGGMCIKNIPEDSCELVTQDWFTNKEWSDRNIPIKRNKENHPDTHRIPIYQSL